jgi:quercetin dioxygenase-like cupin family protein
MNKVSILISLLVTIFISCKSAKKMTANNLGSATAFPKGTRIDNANFTGTVWLQMLVNADTTFNINAGNVTFEVGSRTNWHYHPGGQVLLVTSGKGLYQEQGKPVREIRKGDVIKCAPNIVHWHGAAPDSEMTHIAIGTNQDKGAVVWLEPVTDKEYSSTPERL